VNNKKINNYSASVHAFKDSCIHLLSAKISKDLYPKKTKWWSCLLRVMLMQDIWHNQLGIVSNKATNEQISLACKRGVQKLMQQLAPSKWRSFIYYKSSITYF